MRGRDEHPQTILSQGGTTTVDKLDKDRTDKMTEADRADLWTFVWIGVITLVFTILVWLGLCNCLRLGKAAQQRNCRPLAKFSSTAGRWLGKHP
jgi:hypothetical protein